MNVAKTVVFHGTLIHHLKDLFLAKAKTPWQVERFFEQDSREDFARALGEADVLISMNWTAAFPPAPKLKLIQLPGTGYEGIDFNALPKGVALCNAYGHAEGMAEYTLLGMLVWCHRFYDADKTFRQGSWEYSGRLNGPVNEELYGKILGIVGFGSIGRALAERAKPFGMKVIAINRTKREIPPCVDRWVSFDQLNATLPDLDYIVVAAALGPETEGLIGAAQFDRMKSSAVLLNVGRGPIVEETALFNALQSKRIRGATIDVWYGSYPSKDQPRPAPSKLPFHELDNLYMTPHTSGWTTGMINRRWTEIADNLDRLARGEPLKNRLK
jgi:phosphoglycerate dehydrogenase-like enzyme